MTERIPIAVPDALSTMPRATSVSGYEMRTTRTPTPCAIASRERFRWPALALAIVGALLAVESELRAWYRPRQQNPAVRWWPTAPWIGPVSAAIYFVLGVWYATAATLAPNMVFFGTAAVGVGVAAREPRNVTGSARVHQIIAAPGMWIGCACLIVAATRLS